MQYFFQILFTVFYKWNAEPGNRKKKASLKDDPLSSIGDGITNPHFKKYTRNDLEF